MRCFQVLISLVLFLLASLAAGRGGPADAAAPYAVTKTTDTNDGVCDADCSLREAISAANLAPGSTVAVPAGMYALNIAGANEDTNASGDLDITANMAIIGSGAGSTIIDGVALDRVLQVLRGTVSISGLTIRNGSAGGSNGSGGGIINSGTLTLTNVVVSGNTSSYGGGVANTGTLTLTNSTVSGNAAAGAYGDSAQGEGGGIYNAYGTVTVNSSTIRGNRAGGVYWFPPGGGGIFNELGTLTLTNSAVSGNTAGTGIVNLDASQTIQNSTISGNTGNTGYGGGGILNYSWTATATTTIVSSTIFENKNLTGRGDAIAGTVTLKSTVVASPTEGLGGDCYGSVTSLGRNIASDASCALAGSGDLNNTNPLLGPLANNGGPTQTHAPLLGSPAIEAVPLADCTDASGAPLTGDQRAIARPQGAACDIGAVELAAVPTTTSVSFGPGPFPYTGAAYTATATVSPAGSGAAVVSYSGDCANAGTCAATATYPGDINHQPSTSTASITITPAVTTITITGGGTYEYDGAAHPLTARVTGAGGLDQPVTVGGCIATPTVPSDSCVGEAIFAGGGNYLASSSSATVTIVDTTPPTLTLPAPLTLEAPGPLGAVVTFTTTAVDLLDPDPAVACTPVSGSTFPLGTTTVTCTATDAGSNSSSGSFTVTVQDTTPPVLTPPTSIFAEATSAAGAVVTFTASATDAVDGPLPATCAPASGATFALGLTPVTCTATDAAGNTGSASFSVTVQDTAPPVLTLPTNITLDATESSGAVVTFTVPATDVADPSPTAVCTPVSGLMFAIGTTTVSCTATDAAGNTTTGTFSVHVNSGSEQVQALAAAVTGVGSGTSLLAKVQTLQAQIAAGNTTAACNSIQALLNEVSAQAGKKLTAAQAAAVTADVSRIAAVLGC